MCIFTKNITVSQDRVIYKDQNEDVSGSNPKLDIEYYNFLFFIKRNE